MSNQTILASLLKPGRYLGHEYNSTTKRWDSTAIRFAFLFPDLYEIGMSHQGLQILYHLVNSQQNLLAERCYCPDLDFERLLAKTNQPLTSLESSRPLTDFDVVGITLPYELCYTNILTMLSLASIPFYSQDRDTSFPLIIGGGAGSFNPEPVADFFDAILLGDGEDAILQIGDLLARHKHSGIRKTELLGLLSSLDGIYVPAHFRPEYQESGKIKTISRLAGQKTAVTRTVINHLDNIEHLKHPIVPNARIVHDRMGIEVARGCTRGCRFCQAGITYRPVRERSPHKIMELAEEGINNSGFEELALLSLSTGDYSCLEQILPDLMNHFTGRYIAVAMPSMRVGTLTPTIMEQVKRVRKTGFTLAPEAGSERLRQVINKGITEADLIATCNDAFSLGWQTIKLYFMIGLPTETDQDIAEIAELTKKTLSTKASGGARGKKQITVSIGTFVPKPHTPFQWTRQLSIDESMARIQQLKGLLPYKGCNLRYHSPRMSFLEGVFARGDRRLAKLIEQAWRLGARLDGWDEHFDLGRWRSAAENCHLSLDNFLRARDVDEVLPWDHLSTGVTRQFLLDELHKAETQEYTPDCRNHDCQQCGVCDFDTLMPIVSKSTPPPLPVQMPTEASAIGMNSPQVQKNGGHFKYIVNYSRLGNISYLGHLEMLQGIFRTLHRAKIATNYSQGFNPLPKISFGPALAAGTESLAEFFIMDLAEPLLNCQDTADRLNKSLVPGLNVTIIEPHSGKVPQNILTSYTLTLPRETTVQERQKIEGFLSSKDFIVTKTRKGQTKTIDIRPLINQMAIVKPCEILLEVIGISAVPGIKPIEALKEILNLDDTLLLATKILKTGWINNDPK